MVVVCLRSIVQNVDVFSKTLVSLILEKRENI